MEKIANDAVDISEIKDIFENILQTVWHSGRERYSFDNLIYNYFQILIGYALDEKDLYNGLCKALLKLISAFLLQPNKTKKSDSLSNCAFILICGVYEYRLLPINLGKCSFATPLHINFITFC